MGHRRPARVLEIGAGSGTLTRLLASASELVITEPIDGYWPTLAAIAPHAVRIDDAAISQAGEFDLIVIDGGTGDPLPNHTIATGGIVFFEGGRRKQRAALERATTGRPFAHIWVKAWDRSKGYHIYHYEPPPSVRRRARLITLREWWMDLPVKVLNRLGAEVPLGKARGVSR